MPLPPIFQGFLSQVLGQVAPTFRTEDPTTTSVLQWVMKLQEHVFGRWKAFGHGRTRCAIPEPFGGGFIPCERPGVGLCELCRDATCLEHAAVTVTGTVACLRCLATYQKVVREHLRSHPHPDAPPASNGHGHAPPPPHEDEAAARKRHLKTLGLKDPADWGEINEAFRALAKKYHPDRATPAKKEAAATRFKAITEAHRWLSERTARAA